MGKLQSELKTLRMPIPGPVKRHEREIRRFCITAAMPFLYIMVMVNMDLYSALSQSL